MKRFGYHLRLDLSRSGREGPVASNTSNDRQMAEKIAIHSCILSHTACHLNRLIEPCIRTYFCLCREGNSAR
jgi:hypothetical protein